MHPSAVEATHDRKFAFVRLHNMKIPYNTLFCTTFFSSTEQAVLPRATQRSMCSSRSQHTPVEHRGVCGRSDVLHQLVCGLVSPASSKGRATVQLQPEDAAKLFVKQEKHRCLHLGLPGFPDSCCDQFNLAPSSMLKWCLGRIGTPSSSRASICPVTASQNF